MILGSGLIQAANAFVGAYDGIPSIAAAYSTRRVLTSYTGPLLRLVADRTGYPEQDIGYTAAGNLDTAAAASFLAGDAGYIAKWYDQSGNTLDFAQATLANMPLYVASGQNSIPVVRGDGLASFMSKSAFPGGSAETIIAAVRWFAVADSTLIGSAANKRLFRMRASGAMDYLVSGFTDGVNGVRESSALGTNFVVLSASRSVAANAATIWKNSATVLKTTTISASSASDTVNLFRRDATWGEYFNGDAGELVVCDAALSTTHRNAAETATNAYWSVY